MWLREVEFKDGSACWGRTAKGNRLSRSGRDCRDNEEELFVEVVLVGLDMTEWLGLGADAWLGDEIGVECS